MVAQSVLNSLLTLVTTTAMLIGCQSADIETLTIKDETFTVELAATEEAIAKGMSGRERFPEQGVMLFVFPDARQRVFWMIDCLIDIDLIFLDSRGVVTATHRMKTEPLQRPHESRGAYEMRLKRYPSVRPAQFAIELEAGSLDRLGVRAGDRIKLDVQRLKALVE